MPQYTDVLKSYQNQPYFVQRILNEFKKDIFDNVFFINKDLFLNNPSYVEFTKDSWYMRPHVFCQDTYGEQYVYPVILLLNNISTFFNFIPENFSNRMILTPDISLISSVLGYSSLGE